MIDLTQDPRVLEACGFVLHSYGDPSENYWTKDGVCRGKNPEPTMQERWEALCRLCEEAGHLWHPEISGLSGVVVAPNDTDSTGFISSEHGSLNGCIDAALLWVLDKKEGGE
ncbi:MAG: hypothetical protein WC455_14680 [Dehalococcoidia bacterium]|jgi:hypothetical protein